MQSEHRRDAIVSDIKTRHRAKQVEVGQRFQGPFLLLATVAWIVFLILLSNRAIL
jgi:hypothetical protein